MRQGRCGSPEDGDGPGGLEALLRPEVAALRVDGASVLLGRRIGRGASAAVYLCTLLAQPAGAGAASLNGVSGGSGAAGCSGAPRSGGPGACRRLVAKCLECAGPRQLRQVGRGHVDVFRACRACRACCACRALDCTSGQCCRLCITGRAPNSAATLVSRRARLVQLLNSALTRHSRLSLIQPAAPLRPCAVNASCLDGLMSRGPCPNPSCLPAHNLQRRPTRCR
jgi:hypothetical protein